VISHASQLLSQLTAFAGVVVAPRRQQPRIRQIEFLSLSDKRVLLIIVTADGDVQNRILFTQRLQPVRTGRGRQLPEPELPRARLRPGARAVSSTNCASCAPTCPN
jgi:transcriptional regulator of heat shock response